MISLITITYNSHRCLQRLRTSLKDSTALPYEWVLVDNGSRRPETAEELRAIEAAGEATVIRHDENLWFTRGVNAGIAKAGGDVIFLLNPDCAVRPGWLETMLAVLTKPRRKIGIVGAVLVDELGRVVHAGAYGMGVHEGYLEPYDSEAPWAKERQIEGWITGACLMISREALEAAGGTLDEQYAHFHSDRALADRVRSAGYSVWMSSQVLVHSVGGCQL